MDGLLTYSDKAKKKRIIKKLNQQAIKKFSSLFYNSERANEKKAQEYWKKAEKIGFPEFTNEEWQYTPLNKVLKSNYILEDSNEFHTITADQLNQLTISIDCWKIIFFNGYFISNLSSDNFGPYQIQIMDTLAQVPEPIIDNEIFLYLTKSLAAQPLFIRLKSHNHVKQPLYILNITSGSKYSNYINTSHYYYHIEIGSDCKSQVIEHFVSIDEKPHLTGSRLTVNIGDNSNFTHIKFNVENNRSNHFSHNDILSGKNNQIKSNNIFIGSSLLRHHTSVKLNGINSRIELNSLLLPKNKEIFDTRTYLEHNQPFCKSRQLHKTIAIDESKAIFNGMIKVSPIALKTDGKMTNNNLLFGKKAEINTKPQLEIYADDVQCSHGAIVGNIDDAQLFYLRSRGINVNYAKHIIMVSFTSEIIKSIDNKIVSNQIMYFIHKRLSGI
ncbi:FeS cluster assembly protein SufD [Candidatus Arsenophonus lipoptenae]|uniref:FeS cluster assembly protein SufD n=2 Tax=Candidatus Arsenophonus lipoptenae TaxID=634113 RepID=A0A109Q7A5_9GAMM|nr:FeS cluster assembly protein SufD [Candidatus Arsenophonus lipoptenae]